MLKVSNLSLTKGKAILKGISFELAAGEMLTVLGPSGAGKSSLLRCLNRLDTVDAGEVLLGGQDIRSLEVTQLRRRVGMVFQVPALVPSTVAVNVALGPSLRQETLTVPQCEELLQQVGLNPALKDRMADTLSVGEQQRVALAQLLANRPEVLLLDEPTSALDPTAALTVENLIKDIHVRLNTATVLVTHDVAQARRFNAETLVILNGAVAARGNIQDLINDTGNEPLQKFFSGELTGQGPEQI
ncbi:MAG: ATP-binding cassette domain-containing protein [Nitrospinaceae bacterium]|nr:phosphate ABC transporter ATP-binding protein [Nitrospinaceae bacterium]NIR56212.1 phosphate ABC transporter ATP-binding protein [Nitrospinaceae bacterium]NIS86668.1 phosphate ABC transporter ATP-binding protein [Nitrospinaceae bacterium]NIT83501.1 phosphate ABC transporter ATP-binding protein [Nitrospinaceae bacterium]NIU45706.1 phosphate ABC transporter ATP-binding protein [Nitrospinaceae bacterium]